MLEYETANPGQDFNDKEAEVFEFDEENAATGADVARPNIALGHADYVADETGIRPSRTRSTGEEIPGSVGSAGAGGYGPDGNGAGRTAIERPLSGTTTATGPAGTRLDSVPSGSEKVRPGSGNDAAYRQGPDVESGGRELGGNYRVSGL